MKVMKEEKTENACCAFITYITSIAFITSR
jgi:hypothetical protein